MSGEKPSLVTVEASWNVPHSQRARFLTETMNIIDDAQHELDDLSGEPIIPFQPHYHLNHRHSEGIENGLSVSLRIPVNRRGFPDAPKLLEHVRDLIVSILGREPEQLNIKIG